MNVTAPLLASYEGMDIGSICLNGYASTGSGHNHCAHFVAHVLGYHFGRTCERMVSHSQRLGDRATRSVKEIFRRCANKQVVLQSQRYQPAKILFVTPESNLRQQNGELSLGGSMTRHMGIACGVFVWHYSNRQRKVVKQVADTFPRHFPGRTVMVVGDLVAPSRPRPFGVSI